MAKEVLPVLRNYIDYLVSCGELIYMKRSVINPTVKIPNTNYWWGEDRTGYYDFCWHGPDAYSGLLPSPLKERYSDWPSVVRFARDYQKRLESDSWSEAKLEAHGINSDWIEKMDSVMGLCQEGLWHDAMIRYEKE